MPYAPPVSKGEIFNLSVKQCPMISICESNLLNIPFFFQSVRAYSLDLFFDLNLKIFSLQPSNFIGGTLWILKVDPHILFYWLEIKFLIFFKLRLFTSCNLLVLYFIYHLKKIARIIIIFIY